jgi:uncharacterized protein (DUF3820 family)
MSFKGTYGDPELTVKLVSFCMPFGKHAKTLLIDLPVSYLNWFSKKGFPQGELGQLMRIVHEVKAGDMEYLFDGIRQMRQLQNGVAPGKK